MNDIISNKFKYLIPGYLQGFTRIVISYPFDYIRLYKQLGKQINIKNEIKNLSIFRGSLIPILVNPLDKAISFYMFEYLKIKKYSNIEIALYPSLLSTIYMTPLNIFNSNYAYNKNTNYKNLFNTEIKKNIYRGNSIEIFRNSTSTFLFLYFYNLNLIKENPFINGVISSSVMWSITYPLDTIKTQKFINNKSYFDIIKNTKLVDYYRGISLIYLRSIPSVGLGMVIYEKSKKYLNL